VLETQKFQRVGGTKTIEVNVRVISATNRDLEKARENSLFREDLYYRLNVVEIRIPPLRERTSDIPPLVERILSKLSASSGVQNKWLSAGAWECIMRFHWPGNVRELQNVLERSLIVCKGDEIQAGDLPDYVVDGVKPSNPEPGSLKPLEKMESEYVKLAVKICGGNKSRAAKLLRIDRGTLARKLRG
jgi:DNA-binding NtrC family response regulator